MAKEHYGVFLIIGVVLVVAVGLMYFSGGIVGEAKGSVGETIFCKFLNSKLEQTCTAVRLGAGCRGITECSFRVREPYGTRTAMTSTCGDGAGVRIDGNNDEVLFNCAPPAQPQPEQQPTEYARCMEEARQMKNKLLEMEMANRTISPSKYAEYEKLLERCNSSLQPSAPSVAPSVQGMLTVGGADTYALDNDTYKVQLLATSEQGAAKYTVSSRGGAETFALDAGQTRVLKTLGIKFTHLGVGVDQYGRPSAKFVLSKY